MQDSKLTDELKQMNGYYRLLCGLVNESMGVLNREGLSPEERLERLREKLEFARRYTREMPLSVRMELDANPGVQAVLADSAQQPGQERPEGGASYLVMDMTVRSMKWLFVLRKGCDRYLTQSFEHCSQRMAKQNSEIVRGSPPTLRLPFVCDTLWIG